MKKIFYIFITLFVVAFLGREMIVNTETALTFDSPSVVVGKNNINVDVAVDYLSQAQGLSYRESLDENSGMLFIFEHKQKRSFWMKDMNFNLDIIWIDGNRVIKIDKNLLPAGENPEIKYSSLLEVDKVLEVSGGYTDRHKIKVGDEIEYYLD